MKAIKNQVYNNILSLNLYSRPLGRLFLYPYYRKL